MGNQSIAVLDNRCIEGRPAHVGVDDLGEPGMLAEVTGIGNAAGGSRLD